VIPKNNTSLDDVTEEMDSISAEEHVLMKEISVEEATILMSMAERGILVAHRESIEQNRKERKKYTRKIFCGLALWLFAVLAVTILDGLESVPFNLPEYALAALISATGIGSAATIIAMMVSLSKGHGGADAERNRHFSTLQSILEALAKGGKE